MSAPVTNETESVECLDLRAELAWDIPEDTSCPLATQLEENPKDVTIHYYNGTCHMEVELGEDPDGDTRDKVKLQEAVGNCSCPTFWKNGCHPRFRLVEDMSAIAEVYLTSRKSLSNLISDLRQTDREPSIRNLTIAGGEDGIAEIRTTDIGTLSERERECLEFAVKEGYYERDREVSLQYIADEFGVSKSTCSERLGSAESKIIKNLLNE